MKKPLIEYLEHVFISLACCALAILLVRACLVAYG